MSKIAKQLTHTHAQAHKARTENRKKFSNLFVLKLIMAYEH